MRVRVRTIEEERERERKRKRERERKSWSFFQSCSLTVPSEKSKRSPILKLNPL